MTPDPAPGAGASPAASPSPSPGPKNVDWRVLAQKVGVRPVIGGVIAAVLMYLPTHDLGEVLGMWLVTVGLLVGLRVADPHLHRLWELLDRVPRAARLVVGIGVSIAFSISQFGRSAAGHEASHLRLTLLVTIVLGFVVMHPKAAAPAGTPSQQAGAR